MNHHCTDPRTALFETQRPLSTLPVCDHYAGAEARMRKSLDLQRAMVGSNGQPVFDVTLDLEDGAPVGTEAAQAQLVGEMAAGSDNAFDRVGVRVHPFAHPRFEEDIDTVVKLAGHRLAYVMVPKLAHLSQTQQAIEAIEQARLRHGVAHSIPVHGLIETHRALQQVHDIAAVPGLESLSFGLMDFVSEHRGAIPASAMTVHGQFHHPLVRRAKLDIAAACHAAGRVPSHCVVTEYKDKRALAHAAELAAKEMGYMRMWSIHPEQIRPIVEAFAPVVAEIDEAVDILLAARAAKWGPISHRQVLHDRASFRYHWCVLERAWLTGQPLHQDVVDAFFSPESA